MFPATHSASGRQTRVWRALARKSDGGVFADVKAIARRAAELVIEARLSENFSSFAVCRQGVRGKQRQIAIAGEELDARYWSDEPKDCPR